MNYKNIYNKIILKYKKLNLVKLNPKDKKYIYLETHHIVPKCLGGSDDASNLVNLPAREHFICHLLLPLIYKNNKNENKLWVAAHRFLYGNKGQRSVKISSFQYKFIKENLAKLCSDIYSGKNNPNFGNKWSNEQKLRLSQKMKGRKAHNKGVPLSEDTKRKISLKLKGKPQPWNRRKRTEEEKLLISIKTKEGMAKKETREKFLLGIKNRKTLRGKDSPRYGKKNKRFSEIVSARNRKLKGCHWYNNGIKNVLAKECPKNFVKGLIRTDRFKHKSEWQDLLFK